MSTTSPFSVMFLPERKIQRATYKFALGCVQQLVTPETDDDDDTSSERRGRIRRIREIFNKKDNLSISSYDTAWVAMVPSRDSPRQPCFSRCLDWVMENQKPDGSWGLYPGHPLLVKDRLSSTLACILAMQTWGVGSELVQKGLDFIESHSWATEDNKQYTPIGFDIVFPGMINLSEELGLSLPLDMSMVDNMFRNQDLAVERAFRRGNERGRGSLAYVAEGFAKGNDWEEVMKKHQRSNGSLFNSPSTTAASLIHLHDDKCHEYLKSLLGVYKYGVPTIYPLKTYTDLRMVDRLQKLGIAQYFTTEIKGVLDKTYRCWMRRDEEIMLDLNCLALAFRLLRMNGYDVSSAALAEFDEQSQFFTSVSAQFSGTRTILELFKASQNMISQEEPTLAKIQAWTSSYLKQQIENKEIQIKIVQEEVEHALAYPRGSLERLESRRSIERYHLKEYRIAKTCYRCCDNDQRDFRALALQDFNHFQGIHQQELQHLERWFTDMRLDELKSVRERVAAAIFSIAAVLPSPDLSKARISWVKNSILVTILDDLLEVVCSRKEALELTKMLERWDRPSITTRYSSKQVEIIFNAIHDTTNELAEEASLQQARCVKKHIIQIWVDYVRSVMREFDWQKGNSMPSLEEHISNGCQTIGLGPIILNTLYFLGAELSEEALRSEEYQDLSKHIRIIGRLMNDLQSFRKETALGTPNSVLLYVSEGGGAVTEEDAAAEIRKRIDRSRRKLLRMVVRTEGSLVPQPCKDLLWKSSEVIHEVYGSSDEYTSPVKIIAQMNAVLYDRLVLPADGEITDC